MTNFILFIGFKEFVMKRKISVPVWVIMLFVAFFTGWFMNQPPIVAFASQAGEALRSIPPVTKSMNANYVDGIHASRKPTPKKLLPLNLSGKFPLRVIPQGSGSGLNADKLDGLDGGEFAQKNEVMPIVLANDGSGSGVDADMLDGLDVSEFAQKNEVMNIVLANDGARSGVNADYLDGWNSSSLYKGYSGTQITGSNLAVGANHYWFTFGYSTTQLVVWQAVPTTNNGKVKLDVETQLSSGTLSYFLRVTNIGSVTTDYILVRYTIYQ